MIWPFRRSEIHSTANVVGPGSEVRGDLKGPGGFRIDGAVRGSIETDGPIVIGEAGSIEGTVRGRHVAVLGRVHGDVHASEHLEIGPRGAVRGDVTVTSMRIHVGGTFHGASHVGEERDVPRLSVSTKPFGVLAGGAPHDVASVEGEAEADLEPKPASVRTLPPPVGAVPPPAPLSVVQSATVPTVKARELARASEDEPRVAANDRP